MTAQISETNTIILPIKVNGYQPHVNLEDWGYLLIREGTISDEPEDNRGLEALRSYVNTWIRAQRAKFDKQRAALDMCLPPRPPQGYKVDPDTLVKEVEATHPYGRNTYTLYKGTIYKANGVINQADLEYARAHMRTPGQSCNMRYAGGIIIVTGSCDSGD